jgi:hypothetical protein
MPCLLIKKQESIFTRCKKKKEKKNKKKKKKAMREREKP